MAVKINGELSKKKILDENSISAKEYYQKYRSYSILHTVIHCFLANHIFESLSLSFILIFKKRLSLQKDIIEAKMTTVAAKQIKAEAEEMVKNTAKLSEAVLNKECVYPVFGLLGQHPSKLSFRQKS